MSTIFVVIAYLRKGGAYRGLTDGLYALSSLGDTTYDLYLYKRGEWILKHSEIPGEQVITTRGFVHDEEEDNSTDEEE